MNLIVSIPSVTVSVHTQNKGNLTVPTKTVPYSTNGDNKHTIKVHKNFCMWFVC